MSDCRTMLLPSESSNRKKNYNKYLKLTQQEGAVIWGAKGLKKQVCKNSVKLTKNGKTQYVDDVYCFKLLDMSGNSDLSLLKYYIQENYVQGSTSGLTQDVNDLISCVGTDNGPVWASENRVKAFEDLFSKFDQRYKDDYERYNQQPFSSCAMPLNEMNVHTDIWKNKRPNSLFYDEPKGKCNVVTGDTIEKREQSLSKYLKCKMNGDVATTWPFGIEKSGSSDCPYKDGNYGMRTEAVNNKVDQMWNYNIQGVNDKNDKKYHHGGRKYD